jgi:hypothetical protein
MNAIWEAIQPQLISAIILLIVTGAGLVVAWLKAKTRRWEQEQVKQAVKEVDDSSYDATYPPTGRQKHQDALAKLRVTAPGLHPEKASQMIEAVLPQVREESDRSPPTLPSGKP